MEDSFLLVLQQIRIEGLTQLLALVSALGNSAFIWVVIALVFLLFQERRQTGAVLLLTVIVTSIVCVVASSIIGRACPSDAIAGLVPVVGVSHAGGSMPSYHAATAFAAAAVIFFSGNRGLGTFCIVFAILESVSRVFLCVNYPSDVIVGALLGVAIGFVGWHLFTRLFGLVNFQPRTPARKTVGGNKGRRSL